MVALVDYPGDEILTQVFPRAGSDSEQPKPPTAAEFHATASDFFENFVDVNTANEELILTGTASDVTLQPGQWRALEKVLYDTMTACLPKIS